jgi:hypothetical protein
MARRQLHQTCLASALDTLGVLVGPATRCWAAVRGRSRCFGCARVRPEHLGIVVARLMALPRPVNMATALGALTQPLADTARDVRLRRIQAEPVAEDATQKGPRGA